MPKCPHCLKPMKVAWVVETIEGQVETKVFECRACPKK